MVGLFDHLNPPRPPLYGDTPTAPYEPQPLGLLGMLRYYAGPHVTQSAENVLGLAKALAEPTLSVLPGSGEAMSAQDSMRQSRNALSAALQGNYGQAGIGGVNSLISALGAVPLYGMMTRGSKPIVNALIGMSELDHAKKLGLEVGGNAEKRLAEHGFPVTPETVNAFVEGRKGRATMFSAPPEIPAHLRAPEVESYMDQARRELLAAGENPTEREVREFAFGLYQDADRAATEAAATARRQELVAGLRSDFSTVAEQARRMGYSVQPGASNASDSLYLTLDHPRLDRPLKVRISDHPLPPTHQKMMGRADIEIGPHGEAMDVDGALQALTRRLK